MFPKRIRCCDRPSGLPQKRVGRRPMANGSQGGRSAAKIFHAAGVRSNARSRTDGRSQSFAKRLGNSQRNARIVQEPLKKAGCSIFDANNRGSDEEQNTAGGLYQTSEVYDFSSLSQVIRVSGDGGLRIFARKTLLLGPVWQRRRPHKIRPPLPPFIHLGVDRRLS